MNISRLSVYAALPLCAAMLSSCGKDSPIFVSPSGSVSGLMVSISAPSAEDGYYPWWEYGTGFTVVSDARDVSDAMISLTDGASATAVAEVDDAAGKVWCLRCGYEPDGFDGTVAFSVPADQPKTAAGSYGQDVSSNMLFFSTEGIIGDGRQAEVEMVPVTSAIALKIYDSGHSAEGETVTGVSFVADDGFFLTGEMPVDIISGNRGQISEGAGEVNVDVLCGVTVAHGYENAEEVGMTIFPQQGLTGKILVGTDRGTYTFDIGPVDIAAGAVEEILLDMSAADSSPLRKVGILGDSISTFRGYIDAGYGAYYPTGDVQSVKDTYWYKLIYNQMPDATLDVNSSYAGTRVSEDPKYPGKDFVSRCLDFDDPDVIVIHGGTNDSNNGVILGSYDYSSDAASLDNRYFRQAYIKLIKTIQANYSGVSIICVVGDKLGDGYASSVETIAGHFGIPCVSFSGDSDNIPKVSGSHPTAAGFDYMAQKIYSEAGEYLQ